jgi:hypothetical protein
VSSRTETWGRQGVRSTSPPSPDEFGAREDRRVRQRVGIELLLVASVGFGAGVLTAYGQGWLPHAIGSLANSSGPWALVAFALSLLATNRRAAALYGATALGTLLLGYVTALQVLDHTASHALILFWGAAALGLGPLLGLAAFWVRTERGVLAGLGAGAISGILAGEGIYGLGYIADTTYPQYWWCEVALSAPLLGATAAFYRWRARTAVEALVVAVLTAALFVMVYRQDPISVLH